jgi:quinol monooxygenase YgiN
VEKPTKSEPGCLRYILYQSKDDPRVFTFTEKFASQEAFDFHANTPYIKNFLEKVAPELVESQSITFHTEVFS